MQQLKNFLLFLIIAHVFMILLQQNNQVATPHYFLHLNLLCNQLMPFMLYLMLFLFKVIKLYILSINTIY